MYEWKFDAPGGVWKCEAASQGFLVEAEHLAQEKAALISPASDSGQLPKRGQAIMALIVDRAPATAKVRPTVEMRLLKVNEYGTAVEGVGHGDVSKAALQKLATRLANTLTSVVGWTLLPHLRRSDGSFYRCSCGETFPLPTNFGLYNQALDHKSQEEGRGVEHTITFVARPGDMLGWYGIGLGEPDNALVEGEIPPCESAI